MKEKNKIAYIIILLIVVMVLGGNIMIQAKKKEMSLNQKKLRNCRKIIA